MQVKFISINNSFFYLYIDGRRKMYIRYLFNHPSPLMPNHLSVETTRVSVSVCHRGSRFGRTNDPSCSSSNTLSRILVSAISTPFIPFFPLSLSFSLIDSREKEKGLTIISTSIKLLLLLSVVIFFITRTSQLAIRILPFTSRKVSFEMLVYLRVFCFFFWKEIMDK